MITVMNVELEIATGMRWFEGRWCPSVIVREPNWLLAIKVIRERTGTTLLDSKEALFDAMGKHEALRPYLPTPPKAY